MRDKKGDETVHSIVGDLTLWQVERAPAGVNSLKDVLYLYHQLHWITTITATERLVEFLYSIVRSNLCSIINKIIISELDMEKALV